jgi:hypothetical protein
MMTRRPNGAPIRCSRIDPLNQKLMFVLILLILKEELA